MQGQLPRPRVVVTGNNGKEKLFAHAHGKIPAKLPPGPNSAKLQSRRDKVKQLRGLIQTNQDGVEATNSRRHPNGQLKPGFPALPGAGGQPGNQNPHNGRLVKYAFMNELSKVFKAKLGRADTLQGLEAIAAKVIKLAMKSSLPAAREVFDRVDGKPAQVIAGDPDNPVMFKRIEEMSDDELEHIARGYVINGTAERV